VKHRGVIEREMGKLLQGIQENPFRGAWRATAVVTIIATALGGVLMRVTDPDEFENIWQGLWWSAQTVSTVGYGDQLPQSVAGRLLAVLVMMTGVTFITVTSAAIASAFVEAARRRRTALEGGSAAAAELAAEVRELAEEVRHLREELARAGVVARRDPPPPQSQ
jgi:voltage-gated potassium channel